MTSAELLSIVYGYSTVATAAGTTTLSANGPPQNYFTGSTTQTVTLPVVSTLYLGKQILVVNNSSGNVTVNSSGGNAVQVVAGGASAIFTCILITGTDAASWGVSYSNFAGMSQQVSVLSAQLVTLSLGASVMSTQLATLSLAASALSTAISAISASMGGFQIRMVSGGNQGISATGLTDVSGLSLSMAAGGVYQVEAYIINRMSASNVYKFGLSFPVMQSAQAAGFWQGGISVGNNTSVRLGVFNDTGSNSVTLSIAAAVGTFPITLEGLFVVSVGGTLQVMAAVSSGAAPIEIKPGSYIKAYKLA